MDEGIQKDAKTPKPAVMGLTGFDDSHDSTNRTAVQQEVIRDSQSIASRAASNSEKAGLKKKNGSPELIHRLSRAETVREDARKLKTATLNRMGKMFKQRSQTPVAEKSPLNADITDINPIKSVESCNDEASKKEKSNSLGRMLKLVDKDGSPKKLFHPRAGSLSRILRRHPNNESNEEKKSVEEGTPGIFSRMLRRPHSGNATLEPNVKPRNKISSLPPKVPLNLRTTNLSSPMSPSSPQPQVASSPQKVFNSEYSI